MKSKKVAALMTSLSSPDKFIGSMTPRGRIVTIADLKPGTNTGGLLVGGVSAVVPTSSHVP